MIDFIRNQQISTVTGFYSDTLAKNDRVPQSNGLLNRYTCLQQNYNSLNRKTTPFKVSHDHVFETWSATSKVKKCHARKVTQNSVTLTSLANCRWHGNWIKLAMLCVLFSISPSEVSWHWSFVTCNPHGCWLYSQHFHLKGRLSCYSTGEIWFTVSLRLQKLKYTTCVLPYLIFHTLFIGRD